MEKMSSTVKSFSDLPTNVQLHIYFKQTPDHLEKFKLCILYGNQPLVEWYLNKGLNPNIQYKDDNNLSPLHLAIDHPAIVELLLAHGANPDVKALRQITPLHFIAEQFLTSDKQENLIQSAELISAAGANPNLQI